MTFVPPSSVFSGTISGAVSVSNFPADQLVHFTQPITVDVDNFPASQAVTGPLTDAQLAARLPLSIAGAVTGPLTDAQLAARLPLSVAGPLTDAQLAARLPLSISGPVTGPLTDAELRAAAVDVDGSAVTQPVSVDELPLPDGAADNATLSEVALTAILEREKMDTS